MILTFRLIRSAICHTNIYEFNDYHINTQMDTPIDLEKRDLNNREYLPCLFGMDLECVYVVRSAHHVIVAHFSVECTKSGAAQCYAKSLFLFTYLTNFLCLMFL